MSGDFEAYWRAAIALTHGLSPYSVGGFLSPIPFAYLILPLGFIPSFELASLVWVSLNLIALLMLAKRRTLLLVFFVPIAFALWVGQMDIIVVALGSLGGWLGLALTTIKPQMAIWFIPWTLYHWWRKGERKKIFLTLTSIALFYGIPTLIQPGWWEEWFISVGPDSRRSFFLHAASIFGVTSLIDIPLVVSGSMVALFAVIMFFYTRPLKTDQYWCWVATFNPISNIYSLSVLVDQVDWVAVVSSWILLPVSLYLHTAFPFSIISIYLWWKALRKNFATR